jgi:hypothetical protein
MLNAARKIRPEGARGGLTSHIVLISQYILCIRALQGFSETQCAWFCLSCRLEGDILKRDSPGRPSHFRGAPAPCGWLPWLCPKTRPRMPFQFVVSPSCAPGSPGRSLAVSPADQVRGRRLPSPNTCASVKHIRGIHVQGTYTPHVHAFQRRQKKHMKNTLLAVLFLCLLSPAHAVGKWHDMEGFTERAARTDGGERWALPCPGKSIASRCRNG